MRKHPDTLQGTLDLLILKTLESAPNHGFGITLYIQNASDGALLVEEGSIYPALQRLEREGAIKGEWKVTENGRRARYYRLTTLGHKRLADAQESWAVLSRSVSKVLRYV